MNDTARALRLRSLPTIGGGRDVRRRGRSRRRRVWLAAATIWLGLSGAGATTEGAPPPLGVWSRPTFGSTPDLNRPKEPAHALIDGDGLSPPGVHLSMTGKPCVKIAGESRPDAADPKLFFHMILATNACGERILIQVCYYRTRHCSLLQLPPYGRKDAMLGVMPVMKDFQYEYREQVERPPPGDPTTSATQ